MRINKFLAQHTGISRRAADKAIQAGRVSINMKKAELGDIVEPTDSVTLDNSAITPDVKTATIMLNKPSGYVVSRRGQGNKTVYDLLPEKYHSLKPIGRLDKDSSGLLLLTNDGELANKLIHPRYQKQKVYRIKLNKTLDSNGKKQLLTGVVLKDGLSTFLSANECSDNEYEVTLTEGKNRQIRRTFNALGYKVETLHRIKFGGYSLDKKLKAGKFKII